VCTYVVHQENINEEVPPILQKYGCEVDRMPRLNASTKKKVGLTDKVMSYIRDTYKRDYDVLFPSG